MRISKLATRLRNHSVVSATILALVGAQTGFAQAAATAPSAPSFGPNSHDLATHTPIKHVIIIIGENWSFDSIFATYQPKSGQTVRNLLSEGIVKPDGTPGASYSKSVQSSATDKWNL
jgi:phospholipase C